MNYILLIFYNINNINGGFYNSQYNYRNINSITKVVRIDQNVFIGEYFYLLVSDRSR